MKRKCSGDGNVISLDKKVKILNEIEQTLKNNYQLSKECNSVISFSEYAYYVNYYLKYKDSELLKSLPIDVLLLINNFLQFEDKLIMIYVCKDWFDKFYNNDYFWKNFLKIENKHLDQLRNFILLKYKYFKYYINKPRRYCYCSTDNSSLSDMDNGEISIHFEDNLYFKGSFSSYRGWVGCGGSDKDNISIHLDGIYFEPITLQYFFFNLQASVNCDYEQEEYEEIEFSLDVFYDSDSSDEENNEDGKKICRDNYFIVNIEALRKLVREWLKLSENNVKNEMDWLMEFIENKIPEEANCKNIFEYWPLSNKRVSESEEEEEKEEEEEEEEEEEISQE
ncbi:hypothetical protein ABK040_014969 [Willaertia magna]